MREIIFSGIKPSGELHLGNYLGAIKNWLYLQSLNKGLNIFSVVDLHAITVEQDPKLLKERTIKLVKLFLASGINPEKSIIFIQSHISAHTELAWILNCFSYMGELNKMTQYKDKSKQNINVSVGLFDYPVLMASDILLYDTSLVPVGEDQIQHIELTRDIAKRINNKYKEEIFTIPNYYVNKIGNRVMGLQNPLKKMSKSEGGDKNLIYLLDDPEKAYKKIMSAQTDSFSEINYNWEKQPGISNLLEIYSLLSNKELNDVLENFRDMQYGEFKKNVASLVKEFLIDLQLRYNSIDDGYLLDLLRKSEKVLSGIANNKLEKLKNKIGFLSNNK